MIAQMLQIIHSLLNSDMCTLSIHAQSQYKKYNLMWLSYIWNTTMAHFTEQYHAYGSDAIVVYIRN